MKIEVRYWRLEYIKDGSRKFYEVWLNETESKVWLAWGRINTDGQSSHNAYENPVDARSKALAQVYAKQSKGYEVVQEDLVVEMDDEQWNHMYRLRSHTVAAIRSGDATPREAALNYIEGFVQDCNEFLVKARDGIDGDELQAMYEDINSRWTELKDKFDSAETMMQMVTMRTLKRA